MGDRSKIEWTDATWNPASGCNKVSQGCKNCYAERVAERFWGDRKFTDIEIHADRMMQPLSWERPRRIFVNSMSDLFHERLPPQFITDVFGIMALAHRHTFQVLTKRPERMREYLQQGDHGIIKQFSAIQSGGGIAHKAVMKALRSRKQDGVGWEWPLPNVMLGVSVEDQATADARIPLLLETPAAVRFVSYEPALGPVDLMRWLAPRGTVCWSKPPTDETKKAVAEVARAAGRSIGGVYLDWVIAGGESGPGARPAHPDWFRAVRDQCEAAGVSFFLKQLTTKGRKLKLKDWPTDLRIRERPDA